MEDQLFGQIPEDLAAIDDVADLETLRDTLRTRIREVGAGRRDPDVVGELTTTEVEEQLAAAVGALKTVEAEIKSREAEEGAFDSRVEELAAEAGVTLSAEETSDDDTDDGDGDESGDDETDEDDGDEGGVTAAAVPPPVTRRPLPAAKARHRAVPSDIDTDGLRLTSQAASLGAPYEAQARLGRGEIGETLTELINKRVRPGERVVVAAATFPFPDELTLAGKSEGEMNTEKIAVALANWRGEGKSLSALVAAGDLCAPLTPIYDLPGVETPTRPVRDALPSFNATRGGVQVGATPLLGDFAAAVGVVTAAENAAGGTNAVKSCLRLECPEFTSVKVDSIYACREFDNLAGRAFPEFMARSDELIRAEQARLADGRILTAIAADSTTLTGGVTSPGAVASLLGDVLALAAQYRSSNRMPAGARLQAFFPEWLIDLLTLDIARGQFDRFQTRQQIVSILEGAGITTTFHLDGSSTATDGQVFARATDGAVAGFPATVEWFMFAPGTWLHLDAGSLDLGVVRDSTLNSTNDFQVFYETWENVVRVGGDSYAVTTTVCPSGEVTLPADGSVFCGT